METEQLALIDLLNDMCAENNTVSQPPCVADDIMSKEVKTLTLDHTVNACIKLMEGLRIRHIPLIDTPYDGDGKPEFIGIISERDVLRLTCPSAEKPGEQEIDKRALRQLLAQIVARKPRTVSPDTPIPEVLKVMLDNHFDMVPVIGVGETEVVGVITTTDILKVYFKLDKAVRQLCSELDEAADSGDLAFAPPSDARQLYLWISQTVQDIMTEHVISLTPQDDLEEAINLMQEHEFRHIPIVDEQGNLQGIVSDRDILRRLRYAGKRPTWRQTKFRDHLFRTDPESISLKLPLKGIMTRKVTHILPGTSVYKAAKILHKLKVSGLPVLDEQKNLIGIVTRTNLISALLEVYEAKAEQP